MNSSGYYYPSDGNGILSNYRKLGSWFLFALHLFVLVSCLSVRGLGSHGALYLILGLSISYAASYLALARSTSRVLHFMVMWLSATYTAKLAFCLNYPEDTPLAGLADSLKNGFGAIVVEKYASYSFGFAVMVLTSLALPVLFPRQNRGALGIALPATDEAFSRIKMICLVAFAFQVVTFFVLKIGRASIAPPVILFPGVTGLLALLSETGGFVATSCILALGISRRKMVSLVWASLFALVYISISMAAGWKRGLFQIVLYLIWSFFFLADKKLRNRLKPLILTFAALAILLYFPVMTLRNNVVYGGMSPVEASKQLLKTSTYVEQDYSKVFSKITDRLIGLEYFVIASHAYEQRPLGMSYLVNGRFAGVFTHDVMGTRVGVVTAIGSTLWGFFAATLGLGWLWLCGAFVAVLIYLVETICNHISRDLGAIVTCEFCFMIWLIGLVGSSGVFLLYGKKAIVLVAVLYFVNKFSWGVRSMKQQAERWAMQWNPGMYSPR